MPNLYSIGIDDKGDGVVRKVLPQAQVVPRSPNLLGSEINIQSKRSGPKANVHSGSNPPSYAHMQLKWETNNKKECETGTHQAENKKNISLGY